MRISIFKYIRLILFKRIILGFLLLLILVSINGQDTLYDCKIELKDDILSFRNSKIMIEFHWNNGDIIGHKITDLKTDHSWELTGSSNEIIWAMDTLPPISTNLKVFQVIDNTLFPDHLVAEITSLYKDFGVRRTFRLYPGVGALAMNLSLNKTSNLFSDKNYRYDERISLPGRNWKILSVEFLDKTDINNNLVVKRESLSFLKPLDLKGNVVIATDLLSNKRLFVIKESPLGESQLLFPGFDFQVRLGEITIKNLGALYPEMPNNQWIKCYGYVLGTGGNNELQTLLSIRDYMKSLRKYDAGRDEMVMMNTWGDRGQDGRIREDFVLREIHKGKELGITHLQLDDGWQQGLEKLKIR